MDFLSKMDVSDLIWELPDQIWHLFERKVGVLDERSEDFPKKLTFSTRGAHIEVVTLERNAHFF